MRKLDGLTYHPPVKGAYFGQIAGQATIKGGCMPEKIVFQPAWVRCLGPEHHHFTTAEDAKQLAHYVANRNEPIGFTIPNEALVDVRCRECGHQVEAVTDERGFAVRPPGERS